MVLLELYSISSTIKCYYYITSYFLLHSLSLHMTVHVVLPVNNNLLLIGITC